MYIQMVITILGAVICAITYRMGGSDDYNPKWRDIGCSLIVLLTLSLLRHKIGHIWANIAVFGLSWLFLSMYHKYLNKWFNKPKTDAFWFNWLAHGIGIGLAMLPMVWVGIHWYSVLLRAVVLGYSMMVWSELNDNAVKEELGRGALIIITLPLLLI